MNDILHPGPKLQTDISEILLWARTHRILFSTDIEKMYRQIAVHQEDWDLQRLLWKDLDGHIKVYRLTTVTYGLNCAPFLALRTVQQLIVDEGHRFPKAVVPLSRGRYVDDIFGGAETISEAKEVVHQTKQLCEAGRFPLQKWNSNCAEVLPMTEEKSRPTVEFEPAFCKILGLAWKPDTDTFHFSAASPRDVSPMTKRMIASEIARLYDPLGLIAPILVKAKIILQELWLTKVGWDDSLPQETQRRWKDFRMQLQQLNHLSIPRWLGSVRCNSRVEIHGFSDASQTAMAAAIYVRVPETSDKFLTRLVCAKTRIAPIKRLSIPRLELTAALLLARLVITTIRAMDLPDAQVMCWTDSSVTLTWINAHPGRWKDFVHNRVSVIHDLLPNGTCTLYPAKTTRQIPPLEA